MDVMEKLVELLWEYDQMRMMRMSIEECADRLIPKGLTVRKCENDTKCSDLAICLDENAKEKTERIVDLMTSFYGIDPGYYGVEAYPLASHLIAHGVTVHECNLPEENYYVLRNMETGMYFRGKGVNRWGKHFNQATIYRVKGTAEHSIKEVAWHGEKAELVRIKIVEMPQPSKGE